MLCRICGNYKNNSIYTVREMMFGYRDEFEYFQCSTCGCLQISEFPKNISKYYQNQYYSFKIINENHHLKKFLKIKRNEYALFDKGILGRFLFKIFPNDRFKMIKYSNINLNSKILDVGCGAGAILYDLVEIGFKNSLGIDPYLPSDIYYKNGLKILKKNIFEIDGIYDLIMFNHSFEHIAEQLQTLVKVKELINNDGTLLIRVPTVSSYAWEYYKENWVQLDAPRHFFLHSLKSMEVLAEKAGFKIEKVIYDSNEFQFIGSEQYTRNIPLYCDRSYYINPRKSIFKKSEVKKFKIRAEELNQINAGDSCAFFLKLN